MVTRRRPDAQTTAAGNRSRPGRAGLIAARVCEYTTNARGHLVEFAPRPYTDSTVLAAEHVPFQERFFVFAIPAADVPLRRLLSRAGGPVSYR